MDTKSSIIPGDWVSLAKHHRVPRVSRDTPQDVACARLIEWNALEMLHQLGPPPGMTAAEYIADLRPKYYRDVAAKLAARPVASLGE